MTKSKAVQIFTCSHVSLLSHFHTWTREEKKNNPHCNITSDRVNENLLPHTKYIRLAVFIFIIIIIIFFALI